MTAGTGLPDVASWLLEYPTTRLLKNTATQRLPLASNVMPSGPLREPSPSSPRVTAGAGAPEAESCAGVNSLTAAESLIHKLPEGSKAIPCGLVIEPALEAMRTAGIGLPDDASWLAETRRACWRWCQQQRCSRPRDCHAG